MSEPTPQRVTASGSHSIGVDANQGNANSGTQHFAPGGLTIYNNGVTEERAAAIARNEARRVLEEVVQEGRELVNRRVSAFDDKIVAEFAAKGLLSAFADPAFQRVLHKSQIQAAITDSDADHTLLTNLLSERAANSQKLVHLAISRATDAVESIDDPTLNGLTAFWLLTETYAKLADPVSGFASREALFKKVVNIDQLPAGVGWMESCDILGLLNASVNGISGMVNWEEVTFRPIPSWNNPSFARERADELRGKLIAIDSRLSSLISPFAARPGRFRVNLLVPDEQDALIEEFSLDEKGASDFKEIIALLPSEPNDGEDRKSILELAERAFPATIRLKAWWDGFNDKANANLTAPGRALAYSNAKRFDDMTGIGTLTDLLMIHYSRN